jgi:hypothetical protein
MGRPIAVFLLLLAACGKDPGAPPNTPDLHVSNGSNESIIINYRPMGNPTGHWFSTGDVPALSGRCILLGLTGPTVFRARGLSSGLTVTDSADLSISADWRWDLNVATDQAELEPIRTVCG